MSNILFPFQDRPEPSVGSGLIDLSAVNIGQLRPVLESMTTRIQQLEQAQQVQSSWLDLIPRRFGADSTVGVKTSSFTPEAEIQWFRVNATSGAVVPIIPLAASNPYRAMGFIKTDSSTNAVTLTCSGSDTINGATTFLLNSEYAMVVIKSNGISAWDTSSETPGYTLLSTFNTVNAASADFTSFINSRFNSYLFSLVNVRPANDDQGLRMRVSEDAGANWKSGVADYDWTAIGRSGATNFTANDTADAQIEVISSTLGANLAVGNATTGGLNGNIFMFNPASATAHKRFLCETVWSNASGNAGVVSVCGIYKAIAAITGVQFLFETGNIAGGSIRMYGLKR